MKGVRKVGVQLHAVRVEDRDSHSKCVQCDVADVNDKQAILNTMDGYENGCNIDENESKEVKFDEKTSLQKLSLAARQHCHDDVDCQEGYLDNEEDRWISWKIAPP